jgi:trk system potassium uptake protein TrkH
VIAVSSTTGFASADFAVWPLFSQGILLIIMLFGAMAGSTGGGFKASRALILIKSGRADAHKVLRPRGVYSVQINKKEISQELITSVRNYLFLTISILTISIMFVCLDSGADLVTAITACLTCFSNVGPGLGTVIGPTGSFASLSSPTKLLLSLDMLLGRLEIFPILLLFSYKTWSRKY